MSEAYYRLIEKLEEHGSDTDGNNMWTCPAHDDRTPSLSVKETEDSVLINCFAGCSFVQILDALKLAPGDLYDDNVFSDPPDAYSWKLKAEFDSDKFMEDLERERRVQAEIEKMRIKAEASERFKAELHVTELPTLTAYKYSELPREDNIYLVDQILPIQGNVILTAYRKTGKTTFLDNLQTSLSTGTDFLGSFACDKLQGRIVKVDLEMPGGLLEKYARESGLDMDSDRLRILPMRGRAREFNIFNDRSRKEIGKQLADLDPELLIVDPIAPLLAAFGMDSDNNDDVRRMLNCFTELGELAGYDSNILAHHTGHEAQGRERGASAFGDWPDVLWNLKRGTNDVRIFTAEGRAVNTSGTLELVNGKLTFNDTRSDSLNVLCEKISDHMEVSGPQSKNQIYRAVGGTKAKTLETIDAMVRSKHLDVDGSGKIMFARKWVAPY